MLTIVRHGRTEFNANGKLLGRSDPELDSVGRKQAENLASRLGKVGLVISSPLKRTMETARYISDSVEPDNRWLELDYGELEGSPIKNVPADTWKKWQSDVNWAPPQGESFSELNERVTGACEELIEISKNQNVVVVTHVSPIKSVLAWVLGVGIEIAWRCHVSPASSMSIDTTSNGPILQNFNLLSEYHQ
mgnify:CR=1 FL=1|tara:strand:+ start:1489 stop:2061 length:573 start_codon:yes stop_codon:yes gene_type:complete